MNSFYDVPRSAPQPTTAVNVLQSPVVPEVSMIFHHKPNTSASIDEVKTEKYLSYKDWKLSSKNQSKRNSLVCTRSSLTDKENKNCSSSESGYMTNSQIFRKQVRFESPTVVHQNKTAHGFNKAFTKEQHNYVPENKVLHSTKTPTNAFEQIYMGNIPNRHLDLSIIDAKNASNPVPANKEKCTEPLNDQTNRQQYIKSNLCNTQRDHLSDVSAIKRNEPVIDVYNYRTANARVDPSYKCPERTQNYASTNRHFSDHEEYKSTYERMTKKDCVVQTSDHYNSRRGDSQLANVSDQPSVKDLLKIIQQQNEQLLILQKQVAHLIENQSASRQIETKQLEGPTNTANVFGEKIISSTEHEIIGRQEARKGPKFAIDVMTSFEVSIRRQQNFAQRNKYVNSEPRIQEITESECNSLKHNNVDGERTASSSNKGKDDVSLFLNEPLSVREDCPSPVNSIHVDMQDYSSDSEDESIAEVPWSVYNNVMDQVNNILKNANATTDASFRRTQSPVSSGKMQDKTMKQVKQATMKHLQSIGVSLPTTDDDVSVGTTSDPGEYTPTEISFAVKQLLMKYLPNDHLAKVARNKNNHQEKDLQEKVDLIKKRPEFSFASLQYMKKYNLLASGDSQKGGCLQDVNPQKQFQRSDNQTKTAVPKILDVTALKQQPKLL